MNLIKESQSKRNTHRKVDQQLLHSIRCQKYKKQDKIK